VDRHVEQFDVLNDLEVVGGRQSEPLCFGVIHFVLDGFVDTFGRQRLAKFSRVPRLCPLLPLFGSASFLLLVRRLDQIARWRLR
jgi:hypothetical protein